MYILGLLGWIGSGKGTVGDILKNVYGFQQHSFAGPLKDAVSVIFGWERHLLEGDTAESREFREKEDTFWSERLGYKATPRLILQKFGTEAVRHGIGDETWIAALEKRLDPVLPNVITDVRFPNEVAMIHKLGGFTLWVQRGELPVWYNAVYNANLSPKLGVHPMEIEYPDIHISEWAWVGQPVDYTIKNDGTLKDLENSVAEIIEESYIENAFRNGFLKGIDNAIIPPNDGDSTELLCN